MVDVITFIILILLMYLINPLKNEEKFITTPFLTVFYIISLSYLLSTLNIKMYKMIYIAILSIIALYLAYKGKLEPKLHVPNKLMLITILTLIFAFLILPKYPCDMWDSQYHFYKAKAIILDKTIFYSYKDFTSYLTYPSGFHVLVYILSNSFYDIPYSAYFLEFFILTLYVFSIYYIGESINKNLGFYTALFVPICFEFYRVFLRALFPNALGFAIFLVLVALLLRYMSTKNTIYLKIFSLGTFSLIFTHTFPFLMLFLFLLSLTIHDLIKGRKKEVINYIIYFLISIFLALMIIKINEYRFHDNKLTKAIESYSKMKFLKNEDIILDCITILGGLGSYYIVNTLLILICNIYVSFEYFLKCLILATIYFLLFLFGCIYFYKKEYSFLITYSILMILWIINNQVFGIYIPFYSALYDSSRWFLNFQIFSPVFYGAGLYYIREKISKKLAVLFLVVLMLGHIHSNIFHHPFYWKFYVVNDEVIEAFNFIDKNLKNETILNFGQDSGQFIPIFTNNKCTFSYVNKHWRGKHVSYIQQLTWEGNYKEFINFCKSSNISYVFISINSNVNKTFFENKKYFEIIFRNNSTMLVNIK